MLVVSPFNHNYPQIDQLQEMRYGLNYDKRHQLSVLLDKSYEDYHNYSDLINIDPLELRKPVENYSPLNPC